MERNESLRLVVEKHGEELNNVEPDVKINDLQQVQQGGDILRILEDHKRETRRRREKEKKKEKDERKREEVQVRRE